VQPSTSARLLVTHSPNAGVSYSVHRIRSKSFDAVIVMQIVICHSYSWQQSVLLVTDQPRSRHIAHVVVSTGPRELTEILAITDQPRSRHTVQIVICHSHVCQQSVLPVTGQPRSRHTAHVVVSTAQGNSPRSLPRRVMPRRSQAEAGHVAVRHFFHWIGHIA
jgi:hypothetical protein